MQGKIQASTIAESGKLLSYYLSPEKVPLAGEVQTEVSLQTVG